MSDALAPLLGPSGDEVDCDVCFQLLDHYVELELAGRLAELPKAAAMANHFIGCPACDEEHTSLRQLVADDSAPAR